MLYYFSTKHVIIIHKQLPQVENAGEVFLVVALLPPAAKWCSE